jgi:hypothetical protein
VINGTSRLNANGNDAILVKALVQLTDSLAQEAQPIHEGPEYIRNLLRSTVGQIETSTCYSNHIIFFNSHANTILALNF